MDFRRVLLDFEKTSTERACSIQKTKRIQIKTNEDKLNEYLHTEFTGFSSNIFSQVFLRNNIFKSSKSIITLTYLSTNLIRFEPFETQNDSATLFNQSFLNVDDKNL